MKYFILFIATAILVSCGSNEKTTKTEAKKLNFVKTYEGKIDDKYFITAKIECNNNVVSGNYFYNGNAGEMELKGEFDANSSFKFKEFNDKGSLTGIFEGEYKDGKLEGNWSNAKGDKKLPFYLIESNTDYTPTEKSLLIEGEFASGTNTLKISKINNQSFIAEFCIGHLTCEMGCYSGDFRKNENGVYEGYLFDLSNEKIVSINISNGEIEVETEISSDLELGMNCRIGGVYTK